MPSGSHGGSRGSHSSGGSSFGGGSSRGSSSGSSRSYHSSRPIRFHRHGRIYISTNPINGFFICAFIILIFALVPSIVGVWGTNKQIEKIETDYAYYQNMIAIAEENPTNLIVQGVVTDCFKNDSCDKWYIIYEIKKNNVVLEGYSYSIYTMQEAQQLLNQTIDIAVNTSTITINTDSVPMDYKYTTLSDDGEYVDAKGTLKFVIVVVVLCAVGEVVLIGLGVRSFIKNAKPETTKSTTTSAKKIETPKPTTWICEYCGNTNSNNRTKCSQCGAKR